MKFSKKLGSFIVITMVLTSIHSVSAQNISVRLGEKALKMQLNPITQDDTVFLPLRSTLEAMDYEVFWEEDKRAITAKRKKDIVWIPLDYMEMTIYTGTYGTLIKEKVTLKEELKNIDGCVYIPSDAFAELFGYIVTWIPEKQSVEFVYPISEIDYIDSVSSFLNDVMRKQDQMPETDRHNERIKFYNKTEMKKIFFIKDKKFFAKLVQGEDIYNLLNEHEYIISVPMVNEEDVNGRITLKYVDKKEGWKIETITLFQREEEAFTRENDAKVGFNKVVKERDALKRPIYFQIQLQQPLVFAYVETENPSYKKEWLMPIEDSSRYGLEQNKAYTFQEVAKKLNLD